jgi:hypothetical protein
MSDKIFAAASLAAQAMGWIDPVTHPHGEHVSAR